MKLSISLEREEDGRWIAELKSRFGVVLCYGATRESATARLEEIAKAAINERAEILIEPGNAWLYVPAS